LKKIFLLVLCFTSLFFGQTAKEIVKKSNDIVMGKTSQSISKMTIIRPDWTREVEMKSWSKRMDYYLIY